MPSPSASLTLNRLDAGGVRLPCASVTFEACTTGALSIGAVTVKAVDQAPHRMPSLAFTHNVSVPEPARYAICVSCCAATSISCPAVCTTPFSTKCPPPVPLFQNAKVLIVSPSASLTLENKLLAG